MDGFHYSRVAAASSEKKKTLPVQVLVIGAMLMSIVWLVPASFATIITSSSSSIILPAAFATEVAR